ncbi:MAG: sigma-70 family RNA polymerase sigma factor [Planctomycetes bacterium]|nr:sigma-70 family RNA polymerase sigma factor [Planctomycetota bacterium]
MGSDFDVPFARFAATRDPEALAEVFAQLAPLLQHRAQRVLRRRDAAEDAVQELFLSLLHNGVGHYDPTRTCLPFLLGAIRRQALRVARHRSHVSLAADAAGDATTGPAGAAMTAELRDTLQRAVLQLPAPYQPVVTLYLERGLGPTEIGQLLGRPAAAIRVQLHRGLARLRTLLPPGIAGLALAAWFADRARAQASLPVVRRGPRPRLLWAVAATLLATVVWSRLRAEDPAPPQFRYAAAAPGTLAVAADTAMQRSELVAAPPTVGAPRPRLTIAVVDPDGIGVPDVLVELVRVGADADVDGIDAVTDASGIVHHDGIPAGEWRVRSDRGATDTVHLAMADTTCTLRLTGSLVVRGRVVDENGAALAGANVLVARSAELPTEVSAVTRTAADGSFELRGLRPETAIGAAATGRVPPPLLLAATAHAAAVELRCLPGGGAVAGTVRTAAGPAAGALVVIGDRPRAGWWPGTTSFVGVQPAVRVRTDPTGAFVARGLPPGRCDVFVRAAGGRPWFGSVTVGANATTTLDVELAAGWRLHGTVHDPDGAPIVGASVQTEGLDPRQQRTTETDHAGAFCLDGVDPQRVQIWVSAAGHRTERRIVTEPDAVLSFVLAPSPLCRGSLLDADGRPADPARWRLTRHAPNGTLPETVAVAGDGSFRCTPPRNDGSWFAVQARSGGARQRCTVASADGSDVLQLRLPDGFAAPKPVRARWAGADSSTAAAFVLLARREDATCRLDELGRRGNQLELTPLPVGTWVVEAHTTEPSLPSFRTPAFAVGPDGGDLELAVPAFGCIAYEIVFADGSGPGAFDGRCTSRHAPQRVLTQPRGVLALPAGEWQLHVEAGQALPAAVTCTVQAGTTTPLRIELERGYLTHVGFWLPPAELAAEHQVELSRAGQVVHRRPRHAARPGLDGYHWFSTMLPAGEHRAELLGGSSPRHGTFVVDPATDGAVHIVDLSAPR